VQVTRRQARQAWRAQAVKAAVTSERARRHASARRRYRVRPVRGVSPLTIDAAVRRIDALPRVRADRVAAARHRISAGVHPSADEVAEMILRRVICDRLS
jgi:hypothetical protein